MRPDNCLLDSNTVIYYLDESQPLPKMATTFLDEVVDAQCAISLVTKIEVVGKKSVGLAEENVLRNFCSYAEVLEIDDSVVEQPVGLRQQYKIKLADALIAATALVNGLTPITRNTKDFLPIAGLSIINPSDLS